MACAKLNKRSNRAWNPRHGSWSPQLELPPTLEGKRRYLRRSGYPTQSDATVENAAALIPASLSGITNTRVCPA